MGAIKREMNSRKWFIFAIGYQTIFAYIMAFLIYQLITFITTLSITFEMLIGVIIMLGLIYLLIRPYPKKDERR